MKTLKIGMTKNEFEIILQLKTKDLVSLLMELHGSTLGQALAFLYCSKLHHELQIETNKLWHLSTEKLFDMLKNEKETGILIYPDFV
jgi:hypothetical protein